MSKKSKLARRTKAMTDNERVLITALIAATRLHDHAHPLFEIGASSMNDLTQELIQVVPGLVRNALLEVIPMHHALLCHKDGTVEFRLTERVMTKGTPVGTTVWFSPTQDELDQRRAAQAEGLVP